MSSVVLRKRRWYALALIATIVVGLLSRRVPLPSWLAQNAGDALYATMMFWGIALLAPRMATARVATLALGWCVAVELSQRYHAPWIDAVRATAPGHLVLGQGFRAADLACYVVGVALGAALELTARAAGSRAAAAG